MQEIEVFNIEGKPVSKMQAPKAFETEQRKWLVDRAVAAEASLKLQPQGHYVLAGMQTTAAYFGAMGSYRAGRHVGRAIRPREKLGGGSLGRVRRIPPSLLAGPSLQRLLSCPAGPYNRCLELLSALKAAEA